ncbi:MAG: hypothetical protein M1839_008780 [Geoglossum umbratile]|nr:MAG: hypothetical protein M1839_008780 [Geoglossum umbratile]
MEQGRQTQEVAQAVVASSLESASLEQVGGSDVYGNSSGIGLLKELAELRKMTANHIQELREASHGYQQIRRRFLAHFQRGLRKPEFQTMIEEGNNAAHGGDAVTDAKICKELGEYDLMVEIYGLTIKEVLTLRDSGNSESINLLNARATLEAGRRTRWPSSNYLDEGYRNGIEYAWRNFLHHLKENLRQSPTTDPESPLGKAYKRYWDVHNGKPAGN